MEFPLELFSAPIVEPAPAFGDLNGADTAEVELVVPLDIVPEAGVERVGGTLDADVSAVLSLV